MKLSVVIPVYNGATYIDGCLQSVSRALSRLDAEDRLQVEVIVCDNHSTDGTDARAADTTLDCEQRLVRPPEHCGNRTENWQFGLSQARGEWMLMLHVDDLMAHNGLNAILRSCRAPRARTAVIVSGRHRTFDGSGQESAPTPKWPFASLIPGEAMRTRVLPLECTFVPFTPMRRETFEKIGGFNSKYELVQDWDLWLRLLAHGDMYYHPEEFGLWRQHGASLAYLTRNAQDLLEFGASIREVVPTLSKRCAEDSLDAQIVKIPEILPGADLATLAGASAHAARILARPRRTPADAATLRKQFVRRIGSELAMLRLTGSLKVKVR